MQVEGFMKRVENEPSPTRRSRARTQVIRRDCLAICKAVSLVHETSGLRKGMLETQETLLAVTGRLGRSFILLVQRPKDRGTSMSHKDMCYL